MTKRVRSWTAGLAIVVIALAAREGSTADKPKAPAVKPAPVLKPGKLSAHGLREADLDGLRTVLKKSVDDETLPGVALLLAHKGEVIFKEAYGGLKVDRPVRMASDSKPVAATVVMVVVDQGKMRLNDPLTKFVPEFKGTKIEKATVRQLLSHSAGIGDDFPGGRPRANTLAEFAAAVASQGTLKAPGLYRYSSVSIDVACRCAEKAAGRPFEELMNTYLCEPLGMKHTGFAWGGDAESVPKEARERGEGRYVSGGAGLSSTLDDMAAFYQMHLNGGRYGDKQILSRKAIADMHRKQVAITGGGAYGLGFILSGPTRDGVWRIFHHGGAFGTFCSADSSRQLLGIFFSQAGLQKSMPIQSALLKKVNELFPVQ
ncbi:MAG: serine hydrolase domain-containing protein [Gemmataceae bacterium]